MKLPRNLRIGPISYKVSEVDTIPNALAAVDYKRANIIIQKDHSDETKGSALIHEGIHALLWQIGRFDDNDNEPLVHALEYGILGIIRDNPELIDFIRGLP